MKLKDEFITHQIQDTQIMTASGAAINDFYGLVRSNETAAFIVNCLKQETTEETIIDRILAEYDVSRETAASDVRAILEKLVSIKALIC